MPRFLTGDELGNIKAIRYSPDAPQSESKTLHSGLAGGPSRGVQKLAVHPQSAGLKTVRPGPRATESKFYHIFSRTDSSRFLRWMCFGIFFGR